MRVAQAPLRRSIWRVTTTTLGARALTAVLGLVTFPLILHHLGHDSFGAYATIVSISAVFIVADQGLAVGVRTRIAEEVRRGDWTRVVEHFRSARTMTNYACGTLVTLSIATAIAVPWERILQAPQARLAVGVYLVAYSVCLTATVRMRALEGLGHSSVVAALPIVGSIWLLSSAAVGVATDAGLVYYAAAAGTINAVPLVLSSLLLRRRLPPDLDGWGTDISDGAVRSAWHDSWPMAIVSLMLALSYSIDPLVLSTVLGPSAVTEYAAAARLYQMALVIVVAGTPVLWTHFAASRSVQGHPPARELWRRTLPFVGLAAAGGTALVALGPWFVRIWLDGTVDVSLSVFVAFGTLLVVTSAQLVPGTALTDRPSLIFQASTCSIMAAINLVLSVILASVIGVSGPIWASAVALAVCHAVPLWIRAQHLATDVGTASTSTTSPAGGR